MIFLNKKYFIKRMIMFRQCKLLRHPHPDNSRRDLDVDILQRNFPLRCTQPRHRKNDWERIRTKKKSRIDRRPKIPTVGKLREPERFKINH